MTRTVTDAEMDRRKRVAALAEAITHVVADHAEDKMTPLEVLAALAHVQARFIQIGMDSEPPE